MLQLQVLGGLRLEPHSFTQPKPLVLLSYLSLEGPQQRRHLAELFWPQGNHLKSLSMTLTRLRQGAGNVIAADDKKTWLTIPSDVKSLLESLDKSDWQRADELYTGAFLEGVVLEDWGSELEEWVYTTREYLAERTQYALLNLAEAAAQRQDFSKVHVLAERAYQLPGLAGHEVSSLKRLYPLLCASQSLLAPQVRKALADYGISLQLSHEEAKASFKPITTSSTLPMRSTSFVGRAEELSELASLLSQPNVSLLTLLGPAGVGKTRLALQLAFEQQKLNTFKDGVYFVPLDALPEAGLIPSSLMHHFNLTQQGTSEPLSQVIDFIAEKHILLLLDNFEHLSEGAGLLSELIRKCPNVKVLVTSQEKLRLEEEYVYVLEGLPYPNAPTDPKAATDDAPVGDAVRLFNERALQVLPRFDLRQHLKDVLEISQLVEGLPLGLELAASWVRLMSCKEIAAELKTGIELLVSTSKNIPERHRSLKAAFEQSWNLLSPKEQEALGKLSVFVGGFRREAASEVAGATIPMLASLVDKSLLKVLPSGRYDLHPLMRQYSQEKLLEDKANYHEAESKHTDYYTRLLRNQSKLFKGPKEKDAINILSNDLQNLESAWKQLLTTYDVQAVQSVIQPFSELYVSLGKYQDALILIEEAITTLDTLRPENRFTLGNLYITKARFLYFVAQFEQAIHTGEEGLKLIKASEHPDTIIIARGLNEIARNFCSFRDYAKAIPYYEEAIELLRKHGDLHRMADVQGNLMLSLSALGDYDKAEVIGYEVKAIFESVEDWEGVIWILCNLANNKRFVQDYLAQKMLLEQAMHLYEQKQLNSAWLICDLRCSLGTVHRYLKQDDLAMSCFQQALDLARDTGFLFKLPSILAGLGYSATALGHVDKAKRYFRECLTLLASSKEQVVLFYALIGWSKNEMSLERDHEAAKVLGFVLSQTTLDDEDKHLAKEALGELQGRLALSVLNEMYNQGQQMTLGQILELVLATSSSP